MIHRYAAVALALALALAATAPAGDLDPPAGPVEPTLKTLVEVEPRTVVSLENTPGDAEALFVIDTPGSYYLAGNIKGVAGKHGIKITTSYVTLDLMGFRMSGVAGTLDAINMPDNAGTGVEVRNGTIESWDNDGVDLRLTGHDGVVRDLRILGCAGTGIRVGYDALVKNCVVSGSVFGIRTSLAARVIECDVNDCALAISVNSFSIVENCVSHDNTSLGISASTACRIHGCTFTRNDSHGIQASSGSIITDNSCYENGGHGISVNDHAHVEGNAVRNNSQSGIHVGGQYCRIEGNHSSDNSVGISVTGSLNYIVRNTCANSSVNNFEIAINNRFGRIMNHTVGGAPAVTGNSSSGFIGTEDPWANFAQ